MLVNTRRIGAKEDGQTDIDFAARFTQFSEQFEYGVLAAQEKDDGQRVGRDFLSGRWSWVQDTFSFGLLYNLTDDAGAQRQAQVVATDLVLEFSDKWQWSAIALQSRIEQKEANIEQSQTADGWSLTLAHQTATHWAQNWTLLSYEPQLEVNDFGYAERVDLKQLSYFSSYEWPKGVPSIGISDHMLEVAIELQQAQDGLKLLNEYEAVLIVNTESNLEWEFEFEYTEAGYDDLLTLGHHPVRMPEGHGVKVSFKSDQTKPWVWDMSYSQGTAGLSGHWREFEFEPTWQVNPNVHFGLEVTYLEQNSWLLSLFDQDELDQDEFEFDEEEDDNEDEDEEDDTESYASQDLVGEFEQSELTLAVNLAARWAQRHELSLKLETVAVEASGQSQWLVAATGRLALLDQVPESFSQSEFLLQLRYRYEIGPLSSLYLVYGRGGESETERVGHTDLRLMKDAFNKRDDENLAVKVSLHF